MHKSTRFYNSKKGLKSVIKLGKEDKYMIADFIGNNYCAIEWNYFSPSYDLYLPFLADGSEQHLTMKVGEYKKDLGSKALEPGKIYDISAKLHNIPSD